MTDEMVGFTAGLGTVTSAVLLLSGSPLETVLPFIVISALATASFLRRMAGRKETEESTPVRGGDRGEALAEMRARYRLTEREAEMASLLASGLSRNAIASRLYLSRSTVDTHIRTLYAKTGCHKRDELVGLLEAVGKPDNDRPSSVS